MAQLYLITGFLGAGKTTFLKNFARLFPDRRLKLIINEFGREGIDGSLLRELDAQLSEITNGSIFCACRLDQFEAALQDALVDSPDVILVEASGLADPTNVRRVLDDFPGVDFRGCVCLADTAKLHRIFSTALVCPRQIAVSSLVLLNKTDLAKGAQVEEAMALIRQANPAAVIRQTQFGKFQPEWLNDIVPRPAMDERLNAPDITLQKAEITVSPTVSREKLTKLLNFLAPETWRMKGFLRTADGVFHIDCVGTVTALHPWDGEANNHLVLLAGKGMSLRKTVKSAVQWYGNFIEGYEL